MKDAFYRVFPVAIGLFLGWLLFHPPGWLEALGPWRHVVHVTLFAALLLSVNTLLILWSLPPSLVVSPACPTEVPWEIHELGAALEPMGFRPAGEPLRIGLAASGLIQGYLHDSDPIYATACLLGTVPPRFVNDFVSLLSDREGALTTSSDRMGATLAVRGLGFRQVFPDADLDELFLHHREGMAWLESHGLTFHEPTPAGFEDDLRHAIAMQRQGFLEAPFRHAVLTTWRAATLRIPVLGPVQDQAYAARQLRHVQRRAR